MSEERQPLDPAADADPDIEIVDQPDDPDIPDEPDEPLDPDAAELPPAAGHAEPASPRPSRGNDHIRRLREERQKLAERNAYLEGQLSRPAPAAPPQIDQAAADRAFAESLRMMAPDEAAMAVGHRVEQRMAQQMQRLELGAADRIDAQEFRSIQGAEPAAKRLADRVEQTLASERSQGRNPSRLTIYTYLLGEELRTRAATAATTQRRAGASRIAAQQTRPGNSRSTAPAPDGRRADDQSERAILERWGDTPLQ
jgi:hypothetical protein